MSIIGVLLIFVYGCKRKGGNECKLEGNQALYSQYLSSLQTITDLELLISKSPAIILRAYGSSHAAPRYRVYCKSAIV